MVCPTSYCLSLDVCGPFCPGTDQEETGCRYGLIAVYTVPVDAHGSPLPQGLVELQTGKVGEMDEDQEQHDEPPAVGQDERILEETAEDEEQELSEAEIKQAEINEEKWKEFIKGTRTQAVRNITFGAPMRSRDGEGHISYPGQGEGHAVAHSEAAHGSCKRICRISISEMAG